MKHVLREDKQMARVKRFKPPKVTTLIGQATAKRVLSVAVHNHYKRLNHAEKSDIELAKSNIMLIGPTGCSKTLLAQTLARSGKYDAIIAAALVVDGGIYRHEFVAQAVVSGLMEVQLKTQVPVLSVSLTPHHFQETDHHTAIFRSHFIEKGREAARAALQLTAGAAVQAA